MTNFLLRISDKITSRSLSNKLKELENFDRLDDVTKENWIRNRLFKLCSEASDTIPFYIEHYKNLKFDSKTFDFKNIPYTSKDDLKNKGRLFRRENLGANLHYFETNGSTGGRVTITYDQKAVDWSAAVMLYCRKKAGHGFLKKQMHIATASSHTNKSKRGSFRQFIKDNLNRRDNLFIDNLSEESMQGYLNYINSKNPHLLSGMPSQILSLASYLLSKNINLNIPIVELTGESCCPEQLDIIRKAFTGKIVFRYGLAEGGIVSYSFDNDQIMRVINRHTYVELTSEGEIVITCFNNTAMPLIRYKTGDYIDKYTNMNSHIENLPSVIGRTHHICTLGDENLKYSTATIEDKLLEYNQISNLQFIIQGEQLETILIEFRTNKDTLKKLEEFLNANDLDYLLPYIKVSDYKDFLRVGKQSKCLRVVLKKTNSIV